MTFRTFLFWLHLVAGLISGVAIGIMCFTGTVLAFEKQLVAWSERDARRVTPPAPDSPRLTLAAMQARLRAAQPEPRPQNIVLQNDPHAAVAFTTGRTGGFYVDPYTGEIRRPASAAMGEFMHTMTDLHRVLGFHGETGRPRGKLINGICNLAFFVLAVTGLYLWMPRTWSWRALKPVVWFRQNRTAKARDFNWHNVIGLWSAPVLIVLTLTAVPISFRWGGTLIYTLTGTEPPATGAATTPPPVTVTPPAPGASPLPLDALVASAQKHTPAWQTLTLRSAGSAAAPGRPGARPAPEIKNPPTTTTAAATLTLRASAAWPRTATTTLTLDPYTGEILKRTGYADLNAAQKVRSWTRFLHTGEALGWPGQLIAGLASLGGVFLVYTGFALSWRRFFTKKSVP